MLKSVTGVLETATNNSLDMFSHLYCKPREKKPRKYEESAEFSEYMDAQNENWREDFKAYQESRKKGDTYE